MKIIKNISILFLTLVLSYFTSVYFGSLYKYISHDNGTWIDLSSLLGIPIGYIFFLLLLFTAFGGSKKYWWIVILLIPAAIFELYFDLAHIYIPIVIGFMGWVIGFAISKLVKNVKS